MKKLFVVVHAHYEEWSPYYFEGPEDVSEKQFRSLCDSLLEAAGYNAISRANSNSRYVSFIGWREVVEAMIPLLEKQGYHCFEPNIKIYDGSGIIDNIEDGEPSLGKSMNSVIAYNRRLRAKS